MIFLPKRFIFNETSYHGEGAINEIPAEMRHRNYKKAFIITDGDLLRAGVVAKITDILEKFSIPYDIFSDIKPNPTTKNVKDGVSAFSASDSDMIIAVGGGSVIDAAKAIGIILTNPDYSNVTRLEGLNNVKNRPVPMFAIPTTAGTAAEVTIYFVITDEESKKKMVCIAPYSVPEIAFVDPVMMMSMPKSLLAATGMDALTHAIEGYTTKDATTFSDLFCLRAIKEISSSLKKAAEGEKDAFSSLALGQYFAGMGFSNSGLGLVHSMAHPLGALYDMPHGMANAVILPVVMEFNFDSRKDKFKDIVKAFGLAPLTDDESLKASLVEYIRKLSENLGIPKNLRDYISENDIDFLAQSAYNDPCRPGNPKEVTIDDIKKLYLKLI